MMEGERKRCPCPHSANKQKVNRERDTRCCLHCSTSLLRFHTRPFCQPWDKRRVKANTWLLQGSLDTMEREKSPTTPLLLRLKHAVVSAPSLPPPLPRGNSSRPRMQQSGTLASQRQARLCRSGFLLSECHCGMPDEVMSRASAG